MDREYFTEYEMGRRDNDCLNCKYYLFRNRQAICRLKHTVENWEREYNLFSDTEDEFYGAFRIDADNNPIICDDFENRSNEKRGIALREYNEAYKSKKNKNK